MGTTEGLFCDDEGYCVCGHDCIDDERERLLKELLELRKLKQRIAEMIVEKKQAYDDIEEKILTEIDHNYYYGNNGVIELRAKAEALKAEWEPLEVLVNGNQG